MNCEQVVARVVVGVAGIGDSQDHAGVDNDHNRKAYTSRVVLPAKCSTISSFASAPPRDLPDAPIPEKLSRRTGRAASIASRASRSGL